MKKRRTATSRSPSSSGGSRVAANHQSPSVAKGASETGADLDEAQGEALEAAPGGDLRTALLAHLVGAPEDPEPEPNPSVQAALEAMVESWPSLGEGDRMTSAHRGPSRSSPP